MNDLRVAGIEFPRFHILGLGDWNADYELSEHVLRISRHRVGLGDANHKIGFSEFPSARELRKSGQFRGTAFRRPLADPLRDGADFVGRQAAVVLKLAIAAKGRPRRHDASLGHRDNLLGTLLKIRVRKQRERSNLARMVTRRTLLKNDRRDVCVECQSPLRSRRINSARRRLGWGLLVDDGGSCFVDRLRLLFGRGIAAEQQPAAEENGQENGTLFGLKGPSGLRSGRYW